MGCENVQTKLSWDTTACIVLTDHSACTSLLNTAHPSAKLATWAMAIQEHDLEIRHRSGRSNASADALSRNPVVAPFEQQQQKECAQVLQVSSDPVGIVDEDIQRQRLEDIAEYQCSDQQLFPMIDYLKCGMVSFRKMIMYGSPKGTKMSTLFQKG